MNRNLIPLHSAWVAADLAWQAQIETTFPRGDAGTLRYTNAGKGEPGTALRAAYDEFVKAGSAYHEAVSAAA